MRNLKSLEVASCNKGYPMHITTRLECLCTTVALLSYQGDFLFLSRRLDSAGEANDDDGLQCPCLLGGVLVRAPESGLGSCDKRITSLRTEMMVRLGRMMVCPGCQRRNTPEPRVAATVINVCPFNY